MIIFLFFFKQKTEYEMRISDWSSDVCSSDLAGAGHQVLAPVRRTGGKTQRVEIGDERLERLVGDVEDDQLLVRSEADPVAAGLLGGVGDQIGRASGRESVCQYV